MAVNPLLHDFYFTIYIAALIKNKKLLNKNKNIIAALVNISQNNIFVVIKLYFSC